MRISDWSSDVCSSDLAKAVKAGLADGTVDIVVGTHALLAKGLEFKRLGLVIVDEVQRFGVTHKERLNSLKTDVHVLTLTATPIPRTLQMAMRSEEPTSELQSLMRISYAVICLKNKHQD